MLSLDERLLQGFKLLERLRPGLSSLRIHRNRMLRERPLPAGETLARSEQFEETSVKDGDEFPRLPSLQELLRSVGSVLPYSAVLGLCQDGLPFLLDLTDPAPGGILLVGDGGCGKTRLLRAMLTSVTLVNPPDLVAYSVISPNPEEYRDILEFDNCQHILAPDDASIDALVEELVGIAEERRQGSAQDTAWILAIDNLMHCLQSLSRETFHRLYWLIRHGPRSRVWIIGSLTSNHLALIDRRVMSAFRTQVVGCIQDAELARYVTRGFDLDTANLDGGDQFFVPYGDEWLHLWVCDPEPLDKPVPAGCEFPDDD